MSSETIFFTLFLVGIFAILIFDLGILNPKSHEVSFKEALSWTAVWFSLSMGFYFFLKYYAHIIHGIEDVEAIKHFNELYKHKMELEGLSFAESLKLYNNTLSLQYLTGFFIEYSLSADNLFVILLIFRSFGVQRKHYKIILVWGILGAVVMRFTFIFLGASMIQQFHWILYVFGAFLIFSGGKMLYNMIFSKEDEVVTPENHPLVKFVSRFITIFPKNIKSTFAFKHKGHNKRYVTPLFVVLLVVEFSDLIFAVDSVPAIFSITLDPYIVFFANIFAILGLRSLFFLLERVVNLFHLLGYGLAILLIFIGCKLVFEDWFHSIGFTQQHALLVIIGILGISILLSILFPAKAKSKL
jgi:tellurite resistance protein TerC